MEFYDRNDNCFGEMGKSYKNKAAEEGLFVFVSKESRHFGKKTSICSLHLLFRVIN